MHRGERPAQAVGVRRHQNEVHVVGHQAPRPHFDIGGATMLGKEIAVERIVAVGEEGACSAIAALGDMMRQAGNDDAGETGHVLR